MKILLIGGNGFIGYNIQKVLSYSSHTVTVLDKGPNPYFKEIEGIEYQYGDFFDVKTLNNSLQNKDIVYHLLSTTVPSSANLDPVNDINSNLLGSIRLFKSIKEAGVKRVIYASSGGTVYGNPIELPISEIHPKNPIGSYGISKLAIEQYLKMYAEKDNFSYLIIRPSNPYGPGQKPNSNQGVISNFIFKQINNEPLDIWGDGSSTRDYIYIDDVADFFVLAGTSDSKGTFNLGSGIGHSLNEIISKIELKSGVKAKTNYIPSNTFSVNKVILDVQKIKNYFNWEPTVNLEDGIDKSILWIKSLDK